MDQTRLVEMELHRIEEVGGFKVFLSLKDGDRLFRVHDRQSGQGIGTNIVNSLAMDNNNAKFANNQEPTHGVLQSKFILKVEMIGECIDGRPNKEGVVFNQCLHNGEQFFL